MSSPTSTKRAAGCAARNTAMRRDCSYAVAAFIDRLAKRAANAAFNIAGRSSRLVEVPNTALSNRLERASDGKAKRALEATGTRCADGDSGSVSNGSTSTTKAYTSTTASAAVPAARRKKRRHSELEVDEDIRQPATDQQQKPRECNPRRHCKPCARAQPFHRQRLAGRTQDHDGCPADQCRDGLAIEADRPRAVPAE